MIVHFKYIFILEVGVKSNDIIWIVSIYIEERVAGSVYSMCALSSCV